MVHRFNDKGNLPSGIHWAEWTEFVDQFGWNLHRKNLIAGLKLGAISLKCAGCKTIYIDGSFVTSKNIPNDFDVCWDTDNVDPELLDPILLIFDTGRATQKAKYKGEFFPAQITEQGSGRTFLEFFMVDKISGERKGIIAIDLQGDFK